MPVLGNGSECARTGGARRGESLRLSCKGRSSGWSRTQLGCWDRMDMRSLVAAFKRRRATLRFGLFILGVGVVKGALVNFGDLPRAPRR